MLSRLSALPLSSLRKIDIQADVIILRTDPLYKTVALVKSYTQHVLKPHIDSISDHVIPFINKDIDFINFQSILRNKNMMNCIPKYFNNIDQPILCYKYNKPARGVIINYIKIVSDLNILNNTPET